MAALALTLTACGGAGGDAGAEPSRSATARSSTSTGAAPSSSTSAAAAASASSPAAAPATALDRPAFESGERDVLGPVSPSADATCRAAREEFTQEMVDAFQESVTATTPTAFDAPDHRILRVTRMTEGADPVALSERQTSVLELCRMGTPLPQERTTPVSAAGASGQLPVTEMAPASGDEPATKLYGLEMHTSSISVLDSTRLATDDPGAADEYLAERTPVFEEVFEITGR